MHLFELVLQLDCESFVPDKLGLAANARERGGQYVGGVPGRPEIDTHCLQSGADSQRRGYPR
jgi:hypothetical protein